MVSEFELNTVAGATDYSSALLSRSRRRQFPFKLEKLLRINLAIHSRVWEITKMDQKFSYFNNYKEQPKKKDGDIRFNLNGIVIWDVNLQRPFVGFCRFL